MNVLTFNAGSSSLKCSLYETSSGVAVPLQTVVFDVDGTADSAVSAALNAVRETRADPSKVDAVAHRFVFGGELEVPTEIDGAIRRRLDDLASLDPLHAPLALAVLDVAKDAFPGARQIACFDTAFFRDLPAAARVLPLPPTDPLLRRYGFHGLSYDYVAGVLGASLGSRAVVAHLGSGSSLAAFADGRPVETTMGFSPLGGVLMSSRPGDLDPGALLYLIERRNMTAPELRVMLERHSGVRAIAGGEGDVRVLTGRAEGGDRRAAFAVDCYVRSIAQAIGALAATLGGLDGLIFTGGVGEHLPGIRAAIARPLAHLGVVVDDRQNRRGDPVISPSHAAVTVRVVATDENLVMAREAYRCPRTSEPAKM